MSDIRFLRSGEYAFIRVKLKDRLVDDPFGHWIVEQIDSKGNLVNDGEYLYIRERAIVTIEEARRAVHDPGVQVRDKTKPMPNLRKA
jgi:hypothetical protein